MGVYYPIYNDLTRSEIIAAGAQNIYFDQPISSFKLEWRFLVMSPQNMTFSLTGYSLAWPVDTGYGVGVPFTIASSITPASLGNGALVTYTPAQPTRHIRLAMALSGDDGGADAWGNSVILHPVA